VVKRGTWPVLPVFRLIQELGKVGWQEMHRVFNMGIGLVLIVDAKKAAVIKKFLNGKKEKVYEIGKIVKGKKNVIVE
jgi:phosphoribosylformylglycinamidine cyclo-ligase